MLEVIINFIIYSIMPICGFFVIRNFINDEQKILSVKNIIILLFLLLANYFIYKIDYKFMITILNFFAILIGYKFIFRLNMSSAFILSILVLVLATFCDTILYVVVSVVLPKEAFKTAGIIMILCNVLVGATCILFSKIKFLKRFVNKILQKLGEKPSIQIIVLSFLWVVITSALCYLAVKSSINSIDFWVSVLIEGVFVGFIIRFFKDKNELIELNEKFDVLYNYIQTIEDYIDNEQLNIHEYKNQLFVIKNMTSNKNVKKYIDSITSEELEKDKWNVQLKYLPKGGFKGLLYYKLAQANLKKLNILVNIDKKSYNKFNDLSLDMIKELSRLVGIYLDNAIEGAEKTKEKELSLEIYQLFGNTNIVITNSFETNLDITKFSIKGYTSKGKGRGKGLYLANKLLSKNSNIKASNRIINNYYVQRVIIN